MIWAIVAAILAAVFATLLVRDIRRLWLDLGPFTVAWKTMPVRFILVTLFEFGCVAIFALAALFLAMLPPTCKTEQPCVVTLQVAPQ